MPARAAKVVWTVKAARLAQNVKTAIVAIGRPKMKTITGDRSHRRRSAETGWFWRAWVIKSKFTICAKCLGLREVLSI